MSQKPCLHPGVTADVFADLHENLAKYFLKALSDPESPVGLIKEAREFLKDNQIQGIKVKGGALDLINQRMPALNGEDGEEETPLRLIK